MRVTEMRVTNKRAADRKRCWKMVIAVLFATAAVSMSALAGQWRQDDTGWWYQNENGTYLKSEWSWIDGKCYYFNEDGYCLQSVQTPDGYSVDAQGAWIEGGVVQTQEQIRVQEQSQDSSAIKQIDNVVVTVPGGFVFHSSDERGIYMTSVDGSSLICIMSESLADFGGYAELVSGDALPSHRALQGSVVQVHKIQGQKGIAAGLCLCDRRAHHGKAGAL